MIVLHTEWWLMLLFCGSGGGIGTVLPLSNQRVTNF